MERQECLRLLTEATTLYRNNQLEQVLGNCRRIVEGTAEILCARYGITRDPGRPFTVWTVDFPAQLEPIWPHDRQDARMFHALLAAAWSWTSGSHHYGSGVPLRDEIAFALEFTSDLLMFSAQVLSA